MLLIMPDTAETKLNSSVGTEIAVGMERVRRPGAVAAAMLVPRPHRGRERLPRPRTQRPAPSHCASLSREKVSRYNYCWGQGYSLSSLYL